RQAIFANRFPIDVDLSAGEFIETHEQIHHCRLTGAGCAHQRDGRTWRRVKGNIPQRGQSLRVAEGNVFVADVAQNSRAAVSASGYSTWLRRFVENFKYTL